MGLDGGLPAACYLCCPFRAQWSSSHEHVRRQKQVHNDRHGWADPSKGAAANKATHKYYPHAQPFEATIGPGDIIFIPSKWSHQVTSLERAVSVTSNYIDDHNIKACLVPFTKYLQQRKLTQRVLQMVARILKASHDDEEDEEDGAEDSD